MYDVIATDLDGTLLNREHRLDPFTLATVRRLANQGLHFVLATGRHYSDVASIRELLGIRAYLITSNGARVHDPDNTVMYARNVPSEIARQLVLPNIAGHRVAINLFTNDDWLINREAPSLLEYHQDSGFRYRIIDMPTHDGNDVVKVFYIGEPNDLRQIEQRIKHAFGDTVHVTYSLSICLEVMGPLVSKGRALESVLEHLGAAASRSIAFGDNLNDVELLRTVGHPFVMNNAHPELIAQLPHVPRIGNNFEAAVAHQLCRLFEFDTPMLD